MAVLKDRRECPMNTLSYGLLALLARNNSSGYDLMLKIQPFWQAKHSQIYPLLSRMEEQHLLSAEWIQQTDKPDKKIYAITPLGEQRLKEWMQLPAGEPVSRDELVLKAFAYGQLIAKTLSHCLVQDQFITKNVFITLSKRFTKCLKKFVNLVHVILDCTFCVKKLYQQLKQIWNGRHGLSTCSKILQLKVPHNLNTNEQLIRG